MVTELESQLLPLTRVLSAEFLDQQIEIIDIPISSHDMQLFTHIKLHSLVEPEEIVYGIVTDGKVMYSAQSHLHMEGALTKLGINLDPSRVVYLQYEKSKYNNAPSDEFFNPQFDALSIRVTQKSALDLMVDYVQKSGMTSDDPNLPSHNLLDQFSYTIQVYLAETDTNVSRINSASFRPENLRDKLLEGVQKVDADSHQACVLVLPELRLLSMSTSHTDAYRKLGFDPLGKQKLYSMEYVKSRPDTQAQNDAIFIRQRINSSDAISELKKLCEIFIEAGYDPTTVLFFKTENSSERIMIEDVLCQ